MDEKVVYELTKAIFENLDRLVLAHAAAKDFQLATATVGLPIPLHPGAERFYREKKVLK
jgi:TRAP transporter TAXI family solute receptor